MHYQHRVDGFLGFIEAFQSRKMTSESKLTRVEEDLVWRCLSIGVKIGDEHFSTTNSDVDRLHCIMCM